MSGGVHVLCPHTVRPEHLNECEDLSVVQVIFALPPKGDVDYTMRIYNSDGSEPEMCGNGIRCLARFVAEKDKEGPRQYKVLTGAGKQASQFS